MWVQRSRGKLRGLALPMTTSERVSRSCVARGRKKVISNQLQDQASENSNFIHTSSSQSSSSSAELGRKQYIFVNMIPHYSKMESYQRGPNQYFGGSKFFPVAVVSKLLAFLETILSFLCCCSVSDNRRYSIQSN